MKKRANKKSFFSKLVAIETTLLCLLAGLYITQTNKIAHFSFYIPEYEMQTAKISQENQDMEMIVSAHNSQMDVDNLASTMNFEKIGNIEYIDAKTDKVAADKN